MRPWRPATAPPPHSIIVISGPGGVGKGTIVNALVERDPRLWLSRSWTTRKQRPSEPDTAYIFTDEASFERRIDQGGFLEWTRFLDNYYGTPTPDGVDGRDVVLEIEVDGAQQVKRLQHDAILIFVLPPSRAEQQRRLRGRGDPEEMVDERLAQGARRGAGRAGARRPRRGQRQPRSHRGGAVEHHHRASPAGLNARLSRCRCTLANRSGGRTMARAHDTMMNPPIEDLLDTVDSKFSLVTLAARRARQINSYFNQLGDGLGHMVPPQVSSIARKPLSIGFEEIAAHKIVRVELPEADDEAGRRKLRRRDRRLTVRRHDCHARRQAHRSRCNRGYRCVQSGGDLPTSGRCRGLRDPGDDVRGAALPRHAPRCRRWPASRCRPVCGTRLHRYRTPSSGNPSTSFWSRPRPRV